MTSRFSERERQPAMMEQWHTFDLKEVETRLQTGSDGLSEAEARQRLARYGPQPVGNAKAARSFVSGLVIQFDNILLYVMMELRASRLSLATKSTLPAYCLALWL